MKDLKRHVGWYTFLRKLLKPFFVRKFNFKYESGGDIEGPFLLLVNHNMELAKQIVAGGNSNIDDMYEEAYAAGKAL
jgi:hypothetical protein